MGMIVRPRKMRCIQYALSFIGRPSEFLCHHSRLRWAEWSSGAGIGGIEGSAPLRLRGGSETGSRNVVDLARSDESI
jgi:hypothetical protein